MILADKIILLRKKSGMSQEELADKLEVSRQSVSKWESAQSIPDLDRVLAMSNIFGVSTDLLLKDEMEITDTTVLKEEVSSNVKKVSMEQATDFITKTANKALRTALGVLLCVLSPVTLIFLAALTDELIVNGQTMLSIGLPVLFFLIAGGVTLFILGYFQTKEYDYISTKTFDTEYGVTGLAKERKKVYQPTYTKLTVIGVVMCIISTIPMFAMIPTYNDLYIVTGVCIMLVIIAVGAALLTFASIKNSAYDQLLEEGDYTIEKKSKSSIIGAFSTVYWIVIAAAFLIVSSFVPYSYNWNWIIWAIGGMLYAATLAIIKAINRK